MPGFLVTMMVKVMCPHGGQAMPASPNPRIKIMGSPVPLSAPPFTIAGCPMAIPPPAGPGPTPCLSAVFLPPSMTLRVKSMGQPLLVQTSMTGPAITTPPSPPAPLLPIAFAGQTRVKAM